MTRVERLLFVAIVSVFNYGGWLLGSAFLLYSGGAWQAIFLALSALTLFSWLGAVLGRAMLGDARTECAVIVTMTSGWLGLVTVWAFIMLIARVQPARSSRYGADIFDIIGFSVVPVAVFAGSYWKHSSALRTALMLITTSTWLSGLVVDVSHVSSKWEDWERVALALVLTFALPFVVALLAMYWKDRPNRHPTRE